MVEKITQPLTPLENTEKINEIIDDLGNKVNLSDQQNIPGVKTFTGGTIPIKTYADYLDSSQTPIEYREQGIQTFDVNNIRIGSFATSIHDDGNVRCFIAASRKINGQMVYSTLATFIDPSGNMYAVAPAAPAASDNSTKIPTTSWVYNYVRNSVRTITETGGNNTNWYRVWSDGFKEQGGVTAPTISGNSIDKTITFSKSFTQVPMIYAHIVSPQGIGYDTIRSSSTTNFVYHGQSASGNYQANVTKLNWYACGY